MTDVKISAQRLRELEKALLKLNALEGAGVDNWDGYDDAMTTVLAEEGRENTATDLVDEVLTIISDGIEEPAGRGAGYGLRPEATESLWRLFLDDDRIQLKVQT